MFSLDGQAAFVTGAGQGLGAAIALGLAQAGAGVMLADVDAAAAEAVAAGLRDAGHRCIAMALDVRDESAFERSFEAAVQHFGAIDLLVNNAALTPSTSLWDITAGEWDEVMAVNLRGSFFGCRIAGRHMRERGAGRIVNLTSIAGQQASAATGAHYAASKAGLIALTRSFAQALAADGVTVNALAPAAIRSPLLDAMAPERQQALLRGIPLGRFGEAQEVAAAVVYLASAAGAFVTGTTLDLNGGRSMR
ncbi:SDR family NAD(P)-dependent oxidoreductase [Variovorax ginsengisoli]|jgi:3-oxoacyl-[acyl-carrier protein] reductase|uniref:SDR family NAD(P)-dependent oxidoreductase n=1 Tax=Variovorax ginsengisoli TaxID=363844 RepID=A0ABT8S313_9BURK|nr:SDR family NAD(P)-dependent oxidoreductase [Variovorax ginsengisoli]MDN8612586.1 SDR family NAD(P)-dependent oxidoreductase [Variovorax ginsengisoli]MDO1531756.1 SDR family NAD(P)-dependent oxidoreductase [Variovorax ginsengisoli]